jgi:hypothetical protein
MATSDPLLALLQLITGQGVSTNGNNAGTGTNNTTQTGTTETEQDSTTEGTNTSESGTTSTSTNNSNTTGTNNSTTTGTNNSTTTGSQTGTTTNTSTGTNNSVNSGNQSTVTSNTADIAGLQSLFNVQSKGVTGDMLAAIFQEGAKQAPGLQAAFGNAMGARVQNNDPIATALGDLTSRLTSDAAKLNQTMLADAGNTAGRIAEATKQTTSNQAGQNTTTGSTTQSSTTDQLLNILSSVIGNNSSTTEGTNTNNTTNTAETATNTTTAATNNSTTKANATSNTNNTANTNTTNTGTQNGQQNTGINQEQTMQALILAMAQKGINATPDMLKSLFGLGTSSGIGNLGTDPLTIADPTSNPGGLGNTVIPGSPLDTPSFVANPGLDEFVDDFTAPEPAAVLDVAEPELPWDEWGP